MSSGSRTARTSSGAFCVGDQAGLAIHRFDLDDTAGAHDPVERGAVGKVLVTVAG